MLEDLEASRVQRACGGGAQGKVSQPLTAKTSLLLAPVRWKFGVMVLPGTDGNPNEAFGGKLDRLMCLSSAVGRQRPSSGAIRSGKSLAGRCRPGAAARFPSRLPLHMRLSDRSP